MTDFHEYAINRPEYLDPLVEHLSTPIRPEDIVKTHLPGWNKFCGDDGGGVGLALGWHVIIAGNSGHGKSIFALNLAAHAVGHGQSIGFVSIEMGHQQLSVRNLAIRTGAEIRKIERGHRFVRAEADKARELMAGYGDSPFFVNDQRFHDVQDVLGMMDAWRSRGVAAFIIDYMQLLGSPGTRTGPDEVAMVSRAISDFAKSSKSLTVGLSQFNRETAKNYQTSPTIHGLHGGGAMESEADQVMLIDHSRYERVPGAGAMTFAILGKNRHGEVGSIPVWMSYKNLQIREADPDEVGDWPGEGD